ncbi:YicC/YloC family endoribonuclease [Ideonella sp. BN130291]|uniref:YicC/YloC family endoribonuclease n=1 Tax=Ideonella sp. BN130291 TaxID=3112940 RepID=UPI002E252C48|nr:YicC/YloC family endoribonuclease [Ideonella sp. BN130291]
MAVYSMTGYASATVGAAAAAASGAETPGVSGAGVTIEMRSVNGRFLDLSFRMPDDLRGLEPALRDIIAAVVRRGKIELRLSTHRDADNNWPTPTPDQLNRLARLEGSVQNWLPKAQPLSVNEALQWCRGGGTAERLDEAALEAAKRCAAGLREARAREGDRLVSVLMERIARLRELAGQAEPLVPQVVQRQQERFLERWQEALLASGAAASVPAEALQERALNEAAAYAIRIDVAEELARLKAHLDEITRLLHSGGEVGKRLDFLIQELHREANTLGSKSSALELTNISVEMKVAIEQMREQVQNLE